MGNKDNTEKKHRVDHPGERANAGGMPTVKQLAFTAAGAAGSALLSALLARRGHEPKTVAGALTALGAGIAGVGDSDAFRALGAGAMSGSGAQLVLMLFAEYEEKKDVATDTSAANIVTSAAANVRDATSAPADAANTNVVTLATKSAAS